MVAGQLADRGKSTVNKLQLLLAALLISLLAGCSSQAPQPAAAPIQHIVVIWLQDTGNQAHRNRILEASQQLTRIPGIVSVQGGTVIADQRPVVDSSFDLALVIGVEDREALRDYVQHPLHKKLLNEVFKPLIERYRVYDVEQPLFEP